MACKPSITRPRGFITRRGLVQWSNSARAWSGNQAFVSRRCERQRVGRPTILAASCIPCVSDSRRECAPCSRPNPIIPQAPLSSTILNPKLNKCRALYDQSSARFPQSRRRDAKPGSRLLHSARFLPYSECLNALGAGCSDDRPSDRPAAPTPASGNCRWLRSLPRSGLSTEMLPRVCFTV